MSKKKPTVEVLEAKMVTQKIRVATKLRMSVMPFGSGGHIIVPKYWVGGIALVKLEKKKKGD